ncbi:MAG: pentapeptide repeat-containing protein [Pseudanabaenaceae cyanobacterium bins.68]|nr:pentapeptide repeat-containing protein [Pseudanabaenaceae cyanobacterium bins.68]
MASPRQDRKLVELNPEQHSMAEFDLPNLDVQSNSSHADDPFDALLAPQIDITEAEFFDLVNQEAADQRLDDLPDFAAELASAWDTDEPSDYTNILSPSQLLAKMKSEDENSPEPQNDWQESAPLGNHFSFGTAELDWHDITVGEVAEPEPESYTSFFDPAAMASLEVPPSNSPTPAMNSSFDFEDREDLEEEILFTTSIANALPDLFEQSAPLNHLSDDLPDPAVSAHDLPQLTYPAIELAPPEEPNYFEGFEQEFVSAPEPAIEQLPPLPPLPQVTPVTQNTGFNQPAHQPQPSPVNQPKPAIDPQEQDWLDSFDQIAESMDWQELSEASTPAKTAVHAKEENTAFIPSTTKQPQAPKPTTKPASKSDDLFNMGEHDSMNWTALLDADTGFIQEMESIHAQKQVGNTLGNQRSLQSSPPPLMVEAKPLAPVQAKAGFRFDFAQYKKPLILAGSAIAVTGLVITVAPPIGRFVMINALKVGWLKNAANQDLAKVDLSKGNLAGANLSKTDLRRANLAEANLTGANLANADLRGTNLKSANLRGANLRGSKLSLGNGKNATQIPPRFLLMWQIVNQPRAGRSLPGANLDGFNLNSANLRNANLIGSKLSWVNFDNANLGGADLSEADLNGANFNRANLSGAIFSNAKWSKSRVPRTNGATTCPNGRKGPCNLVR